MSCMVIWAASSNLRKPAKENNTKVSSLISIRLMGMFLSSMEPVSWRMIATVNGCLRTVGLDASLLAPSIISFVMGESIGLVIPESRWIQLRADIHCVMLATELPC